MRLGKTQVEFENGYYVMDLLDVLDADTRRRAGETLDALNVNVMSHTTDADGFRSYTNDLQRKAGFATADKPAFDKAGFNKLREQMRSGRV